MSWQLLTIKKDGSVAPATNAETALAMPPPTPAPPLAPAPPTPPRLSLRLRTELVRIAVEPRVLLMPPPLATPPAEPLAPRPLAEVRTDRAVRQV